MKRFGLTHVVIVAALLAAGAAYWGLRAGVPESPADASNVTVVDGTQYVDITAKGGYAPRKSSAQAGLPTVLRVRTKGTFDCSSALRIPSLGYSRNLSQSEVTEIDLGTPKAGTLQGLCSMGMYSFLIEFKS